MSTSSTPPCVAEGRPALRGMSLAQMRDLLAGGGFEPFRARQLYHWVYRRAAGSPEEMHNLPAHMRRFLAERCRMGGLELVRADGPAGATRKLLLRAADGRLVEAVVMRGGEHGRTALCVSSQVGCALGCAFCLTGLVGFQRNLATDEITGQVLAARRHELAEGETLHRVVFMGMGEPLLNLEAVAPALRLMIDPDGMGLSRRRTTVSTAGVVPGIDRLGAEGIGVGLAVSLNATTDPGREAIMPLNRRWPIGDLVAAIERFPMERRRRVTIEYVLLGGVNDTAEDAARLAGLLPRARCKVNLIMFNPSPRLPYEPSSDAAVDRFAGVLSAAGLTVTVRWSKGATVAAACGHLAAHGGD